MRKYEFRTMFITNREFDYTTMKKWGEEGFAIVASISESDGAWPCLIFQREVLPETTIVDTTGLLTHGYVTGGG